MTLLGVNLRVSGYSSQGGRKYMEDALVIAAQETEDGEDLEYAFFAVYDGHGGKEAALFAKEHLMGNIISLRHFWSEDDDLVLKAIRDGFLMTHLAMWKELDSWPKTATGLPSTAGTTASVAFIRRGKLYIGHVGDSKIVLGHTAEGTETWEALPLTTDHKPDTPEEKKRIYECGGLIMKKSGIDRVVWKRPKTGHQGPVRRSTDFDRIPFLAVARSLGDLWSYDYLCEEFVVSPEPDVSVITLDPQKDHCLVLASDGLWNMLTPCDAVVLVQDAERENDCLVKKLGISNPKHPLLNNPSKVLVSCALERWNKLCMRADNTSVITVLIEPLGPHKNALHAEQDFAWSMLQCSSCEKSKNCSVCTDKCGIKSPCNNKGTGEYESNSGLSKSPPAAEIRSTDSVRSVLSDAPVQRSSASPLQSLNICNDLVSVNSRHLWTRTEASGMENMPFPIPRWSKSASGQTSLSKLASWSKLVSWRRSSYTDTHKMTFCVRSEFYPSENVLRCMSHCKIKQKCEVLPSENSCDSMVPRMFPLIEKCKELSCQCADYACARFCEETFKRVSSLRHSIKRKYPGSDYPSFHSCKCSEHFKCECNMPWKRKLVANRTSLTAFKTINEFRLSQFQRLKF